MEGNASLLLIDRFCEIMPPAIPFFLSLASTLNIIPTRLPDVLILEPTVFGDDRGFFFESFNARTFKDKTGLNVDFVQDNHSRSQKNVLRGLHYQIIQPQGKLVRVVEFQVFGEVKTRSGWRCAVEEARQPEIDNR